MRVMCDASLTPPVSNVRHKQEWRCLAAESPASSDIHGTAWVFVTRTVEYLLQEGLQLGVTDTGLLLQTSYHRVVLAADDCSIHSGY